MEWHAMSRQHCVEIKVFKRFKCADPFIEHGVAHVCQAGFHQVSRAYDSFFRQKDNRVALRVAPPQEEKLDFTLAPVDRNFRRIRRGGWSWLELLELFQIRLCCRELLLEGGPLRRILCVAHLFFERFY